MPVVYFDSSAFVKLIVDESGSDTAARLWDEADTVVASRLAYPEVRAALAAAGRAGGIDGASERRARANYELYWAATRVVELTPHIGEEAAALTSDLILGGADAVHLASALTLREVQPVLAAWDRRLWTAAVELGLSVAPAQL